MIRVERAPASGTCPEPASPEHSPSTVRVVRDLRSGLQVRLTDAAGHSRAAVVGEVDLGCTEMLADVLRDTLLGAPAGLDVDLSRVVFFDCSGLNVLLGLRAHAEGLGTPLTLTHPSPAVSRVLELTGSSAVFG